MSAFLLTLALASNLSAQVPTQATDIAPLLIGEILPNTTLTAMDGTATPFLKIAQEKPTVLVVYRGGWCPYCNVHLAALGKSEAEILALGYQIVAVSPDHPQKLQTTAEKDELNYRLYSDASGDFVKAAGLAFQAPEKYGQMLLDWSDGKNTGYLPVPAVFVLNTKGEILFEYINPDFKKRLESELLLAVLKTLEAE